MHPLALSPVGGGKGVPLGAKGEIWAITGMPWKVCSKALCRMPSLSPHRSYTDIGTHIRREKGLLLFPPPEFKKGKSPLYPWARGYILYLRSQKPCSISKRCKRGAVGLPDRSLTHMYSSIQHLSMAQTITCREGNLTARRR